MSRDDALEAAADALAAAADALRAAARSPRAAAAPPDMLSVDDAARRLGISRTTLYQLADRGGLRTVKVGRRRLVAASDLAAYIEATRAAW